MTARISRDAGTEAEMHERRTINDLIDRYEAVRRLPGRPSIEALNALGLALQRYGRPYARGDWIYRWCREQEDVTRLPYAGRCSTYAMVHREGGHTS